MYDLLIWIRLMNQSLSESVIDLFTEPQVINNTNKRKQATKRTNNIIIKEPEVKNRLIILFTGLFTPTQMFSMKILSISMQEIVVGSFFFFFAV